MGQFFLMKNEIHALYAINCERVPPRVVAIETLISLFIGTKATHSQSDVILS